MATFRKRGSRWQAQIRRLGQKPLSKTFTNKRDAEAWARQTEAALERGEPWQDQISPVTLLLKDALRRYCAEITPAKRGAAAETYRIGKMMRAPLANMQLANIGVRDIAIYRDQRLRHVSNDSVRKEMQILRQVFELARTEWGYGIGVNPLAQVRLPQPGAARVRRISQAEAVAIASAMRSTRNVVVIHVIRFAVMTGMRRSEILNVLWKNVDWTNSTLLIPKTKNGHSRIVPLSPHAFELLRNLHSRKLDPNRAFPIGANAFRLAWQRLRDRAGVQDLRFHDLRHEAISRFFEQGLSLPEVALISGHRDPRQLMRYTHLDALKIARKLGLGGDHDLAI